MEKVGEKVGFGPRFLALLFDAVLVFVGLWILGLIFGVGMWSMGGDFSFVLILMAIIPLAYTSTEIFSAATPGKQFMKLKIKSEDGTEASQSVLQKRWAIKFSASLLRLVALVTTISLFGTLGHLAALVIFVGCFFVLSPDKQALHDKLAKTAVFRIG